MAEGSPKWKRRVLAVSYVGLVVVAILVPCYLSLTSQLSQSAKWVVCSAFILIGIVVGISPLFRRSDFAKSSLETVKGLTEILAIAGAAMALAFHFLGGDFLPNLKVQVHTERSENQLGILVELHKGDRRSLDVRHIEARVMQYSPDGSDVQTRYRKSFPSIDRKVFAEPIGGGPVAIDWETNRSESWRYANLTADEEATFSCYSPIDASRPALIDVIVLGRVLGDDKLTEWRSSTVALAKSPSERNQK